MSQKQRSALTLSVFLIGVVFLSACTQSLSSAPVETPTLIPTGLFVSPIASVENPMEMIEQFAKQTEAAQTAAAGGGTPAATTGTPQPGVTDTVASATPTPTATLNAGTPTNANPAVAVTTSVAPIGTAVPPGSRPPEYTLRPGEFPYCIARRFNVDPDALLSANGLTSPDIYYAGLKLIIPQSAGGFPGSRALKPHPASYTVASANETVYTIACAFGDVDPNAIASANSISTSSNLTVGQQLQIP